MMKYKRYIGLVAVVLIVVLIGVQYIMASNTTKVPNPVSTIIGWGQNIWVTSGTSIGASGSADTQYIPINAAGNVGLGNTRDSVDVIAYTYSNTGSRSAVKLRLQQSANGTSWATTTLGTDSTSFTTTSTTLATATANRFPIGYLRYGLYPYNRLLYITGHANAAADTSKYQINVLITVNGR